METSNSSARSSNGSTRSLARLNMLLHKQDGARIDWCDTLNSPTLIESDHLMRFDVVVANPPFSLDKWWGNTDSEGNTLPDPYKRFTPHMPPKSRGDYAFILHMLAITRPTADAWRSLPRMACCSGRRKEKFARS